MRLIPVLLALVLAGCTPVTRAAGKDWTVGEWDRTCRYDLDYLPELSGLAAGVRHKGILWAINDSGQAPIVYALDQRSCEISGQATILTDDYDWEALASGRNSSGQPVLWIGDIGDNRAARETAAILEIPEPALGTTTNAATIHRFRYPDGPVDAEALIAGRDGRRLWVVTKQFAGAMYRVRPTAATSRARRVALAPSFATDAAYHPRIGYAIRDYSRITLYAAPIPGRRLGSTDPPSQSQAEAVAFSRDGRWLYTASEGDSALLRARIRR